jgi:group I intron endonuclease
MLNHILLLVYNYNNDILLKDTRSLNGFSDRLYSYSSIEPEFSEDSDTSSDDNDDFIATTVKNNNLITIKFKLKFDQQCKLDLNNLKSVPVSPIYNLLKDKETILKEYKNKSGIYLIHNNINGKQYVGSGTDLGKRLAVYYFPSRLIDNRYISNSILKYGHDNFSIIILDVLGNAGSCVKTDIINKEQGYINIYKPVLNLNPLASSSLGFRHSEESKKLISEFRKGKPLSENTKKRLSLLFTGELNPFWSKIHSSDTLDKMRKSKIGKLNPMFNKDKSKEFLLYMNKDKKGSNNPMFGKAKSEETLAKLRKKIYIYDDSKQFIKYYDSIKSAVKDLHIAAETIKKYLNTNKLYKNKYFYSELQ